MSLTDKQQAFVREYLIDFNGTQAAIRAGYSEATAKSKASHLLTEEEISKAVQQGIKDLEDKAELTKVNLLEMLQKIMEMTTYDINHCQKSIKAIEVYARMCGLNEPDKIEHSGSGFNLTIEVPEEDK